MDSGRTKSPIVDSTTRRSEKFWREKTLDQLAVEQGIGPMQRLEEVLGAGAGLWENDREFENFLQEIYRRRKETRGMGGE